MEFINCTFNADSKPEYSMWCYSKDASFKNCTFNGYGKWINVYCENNSEAYNISFEGCRFVNLGAKNKAAVNVKDFGSAQIKYNVFIKNCTVSGAFPEKGEGNTAKLNVLSPLVQVDDITGKDGFITVTLDDVMVFDNRAK